ncbi:MAG: hypothetical protein J6Y87_07075 [Muribaculaceae bacterium]|nr:hypothetical protein [Muribaculaceae bacterium]
MTITEKIKASIQRVHGEDFGVYYDDDPKLNLRTGTMTFPCALVQLITQGELDQTSGQWREVVSAAVFFVDLSEFDFNADNNEEIIDDCKRRALRWLASIQFDPYIELVRWSRTSRVYQRFDDILTGFAVMVDLKELEGISDCEEYICPSDFNDDFNDDFGGRCFNPIYYK